MSNYSSLFRVLSPSRVQTKIEEKSLPARYTDIMIFCLVQETPTSTNIRIIVEPPPPATTEKGKRSLVDSDEGQNSKRAKFADLNIISTAHKIMEGIMKLDENESTYSNPKNFLSSSFMEGLMRRRWKNGGKSNKHTWDRHVGLMSSFITNTHPKLGYREVFLGMD
ncbi:unnamed protein product [Rhizophagus irregularis]|nr:unnamed protein product [Rhizophagus irregularis]